MDPTEQTAAVLTGWFTAWSVNEVFHRPVPAIMLGLIVLASMRGNYKRRWARPSSAG